MITGINPIGLHRSKGGANMNGTENRRSAAMKNITERLVKLEEQSAAFFRTTRELRLTVQKASLDESLDVSELRLIEGGKSVDDSSGSG